MTATGQAATPDAAHRRRSTLSAEDLEYIRRSVAQAPPPSQEQIETLRRLLPPAPRTANGRTAASASTSDGGTT